MGGAPFVFGHALIGATAGGWVLAVVFPDAADPGSEEGPIVADHRVRVPARVLVAAVASVSVAIIAEREPGSTSDLAVARAAIVAADDLPSGWESCCVARTYRGSGLDMHLCGSAGLPAHTAGFDRQFVLNKTDEGVEGDIVQAVFLAPTVEAARREFAATDAPGYAACAQASVERRVRSVISDATGEPQTSSARSPLPAGASGIVDRFTTSLPVPEGHDVVFTAFVRMQTGRAIVRMPILTYAAPLTDEELARIVGPAARTLERALRDAPS